MPISVCIDWGSSSFRAYRFSPQGRCVDKLDTGDGIKSVIARSNRGAAQDVQPQDTATLFESVFFELVGHWLQPGDTVLLSGMITSRSGWVESGYLPCPADLGTLARHASKHIASSARHNSIHCLFLPGISQTRPMADVMRGEELQLLGVANTDSNALVILPGTHSKWAYLDGNTVNQFHTLVTGELYELLLHQSLVGSLAKSGFDAATNQTQTVINNNTSVDDVSFLEGVSHGFEHSTLVRALFTCRSSVLLNQREPDTIASLLSGLLIGNEIREGMQLINESNGLGTLGVSLVGNRQLCQQYHAALAHCDIPVVSQWADTVDRTANEGTDNATNLATIRATDVETGDAAIAGFQRLIPQLSL